MRNRTGLLIALVVTALSPSVVRAVDPVESLRASRGRIQVVGGGKAPAGLSVETSWNGAFCRAEIVNASSTAVAVEEVVLFDFAHGLAPTTSIYGEGFTMLSQTIGTLAKPVDVDRFTDRKHYRLPERKGFRTLYGMMRMMPESANRVVLGFSSCVRFVGKFHVNGERIEVVVGTDGLTLKPGVRWKLEELMVASGPDHNAMLSRLAERIETHHPRLQSPKLPTGWCSWYCFGPRVTGKNVLDNLSVIRKKLPQLRYIQIDDGYQPWMGDWLETGKAFGGDVRDMLKRIRDEGFEPAIWVAPFVASPQSKLFKEHPEWFVKNDLGKPLNSSKVTFGGWRLGPWYILDGTHPGAQRFLEKLFRTMREKWACTYFKLDANAWGAMPFGKLHDPEASHVEAYRRGMAAVRRGAGSAFLLGCNHPLWPSLGEIHGSRSSMDVQRRWSNFTRIGRENLLRNWQNNRLWWNDPDCVVLTGRLKPNEYQFHTSLIYATGGMMLSGDDLTKVDERQLKLLRQLAANPGDAAEFESDRLEIGRIGPPQRRVLVLLNWTDQPARREFPVDGTSTVTDLWTGETVPVKDGRSVVIEMPPRSGRLLRVHARTP
jgi:alpha-galactosidase